MLRLYTVALLLEKREGHNFITKPTLSYRSADTEAEALGLVMQAMSHQFPDFNVSNHLVQEINPEIIRLIYEKQMEHMQPPAAPVNSSTSTRPMNYEQFVTAYTMYMVNLNHPVDVTSVETSWLYYQKNPAGHFLSR